MHKTFTVLCLKSLGKSECLEHREMNDFIFSSGQIQGKYQEHVEHCLSKMMQVWHLC